MIIYKPTAIFIILIALLSCSEKKQKDANPLPQYTIEGEVSGFEDGTKIYLYSLDTFVDIDSTIIQNNRFKMNGHIADAPGHFWLRVIENEEVFHTVLLIKNEHIKIKADKSDFPWNVKTEGSLTDNQNRELLNLTKDLDIKRDSLITEFHSLSIEYQNKAKNNFLDEIAKIDSIIKQKSIDYIKENNTTYAGIVNLGFYKNELDKGIVQAIFNNYTDELKNSKYGNIIKLFLKYDSIEIGHHFVDFEAINQKGENTRLAHLMEENKYLLINYNSANCGFSIEATSELKLLHKNFKESLNIVSFSSDIHREDWIKTVEREGYLWPSLWDGKGFNSENAMRYNFSTTPTFVLINPEGIIINKWVGYSKNQISNDIEKHLSL